MNPLESDAVPASLTLRHGGVPITLVLVTVLFASALSGASLPNPRPASAPTLDACTFVPNPRTNTSYDCLDPSAPTAYANVSIAFQVNVSDPSGNGMTVTFHFDYYNLAGVNPDSPVRTVDVPAPSSGIPVSVNVTWTYTEPNANLSGPYIVQVNVTNSANEWVSPDLEFVVYVAYNQPPSMGGLPTVNPVSKAIRPLNPVVPLVYENVTVYDPDNDPLTLTWEWGDGTWTVNTTEPITAPLALSFPHQYPLSLFPLNETPRYVDIPVHVWIDDGLGHNESLSSTTEFYLDIDFPPMVRIEQPVPGSVWKAGDPVTFQGEVVDPEGNPTTSYWDFDNRTDSTSIGDPTRNQDALGTTATHAYTVPGTYNVSLWSTDGDKLLCIDPLTCSDFTTHWRTAVVPIQVVENAPPVLAVDNATGVAGTPLTLHASVYDADGDSMTVRWDFGDGSPEATNVTPRVPRGTGAFALAQEHNYTMPGFLTLTLNVSDGNSSVNLSRTILVQSFNYAPVVLGIEAHFENGTLAANSTFLLNQTFSIDVRLYDPENDTLKVTVNWADSTFGNFTVDPKTASACSMETLGNASRRVCVVSFTHKYTNISGAQVRNYTIGVSVTDNMRYFAQNTSGGPPYTLNHTVVLTVTVFVTDYRSESLGPWDWWDYSTLAAVIGVPALLIGRFAWKVRREREEL